MVRRPVDIILMRSRGHDPAVDHAGRKVTTPR